MRWHTGIHWSCWCNSVALADREAWQSVFLPSDFLLLDVVPFLSLVHVPYMERFTFGHHLLSVSAYMSATIKNALILSLLSRSYLSTVPPLCGPWSRHIKSKIDWLIDWLILQYWSLFSTYWHYTNKIIKIIIITVHTNDADDCCAYSWSSSAVSNDSRPRNKWLHQRRLCRCSYYWLVKLLTSL